MTYVSRTPIRALGKQPAVIDPRMLAMHKVVDLKALPPVPMFANWRAMLPPGGVPMLGNDIVGNCVFASIFHYIILASLYTNQPLPRNPTTAECIGAYSAVTGYTPTDPSTDQGTVVMGPGGAFAYWAKQGIVCGGTPNVLSNAVTIDHTNPDHMKLALMMGPVFTGAIIHQSDEDSPFMWQSPTGPVLGGHEFLTVGFETLSSGKTYYDVETWDGEWRYDDDWLAAEVDETAMVLDKRFFDANGIDPAGVDFAAFTDMMAQLRSD